MGKYESVVIIKPNLKDKELNELKKDIEKNLKKVSIIIEKEELGLKKLPYQIQKFNEGIYISYHFQLKRKERIEKDEIRLIENYFRTRVEVIKFIVIKTN